MDSYVVEPQSLFVPYLSDVLARTGMRVVRVSQRFDVDDILRTRPEALFLDADYLDVDAADAVSALRAALPQALICAYSDAITGRRLRGAGADCVLSKRSDADTIAAGLTAAQAGGGFVDPAFEDE